MKAEDIELLDLIDRYASKRAVHSAVESMRMALCKHDRGPLASELQAQREARELREQIETHIRNRNAAG